MTSEKNTRLSIAVHQRNRAILALTSPLLSKIYAILEGNMNWSAEFRQRCAISSEEFSFLVSYDIATPGQRHKMMLSEGFLGACTFTKIITYEKSGVLLQYTLSLIYSAIEFNRTIVNIFIEFGLHSNTNVLRPYYRLLNHEEPFVICIAGVIVTQLLSWGKASTDIESMKFFFLWIQGRLTEKKHPYQLDLIRCLQTLLQNNKYRQVFDLIDGVSFIINMLSHRNNFQVQYQLIFCLWLLTFKSEIASKEIMPSTVIKLLSDCLNDSAKEKVVRITLALFKNLLTIPEESSIIKQNTIVMLRYRVLKQLMVLRKQKYSDEDIVNDIHFLIDHLTHTLEDLSSFDLYESELKSGELRWSPPHKSTEFWNQNATKFNDNNYEKLRRLTDILKDSNEPKILSIACYDVGQYVQAYSPGKKIIELLGAKTIIMSLLHHPDPSVKYEALLAVQKIMIRNLGWLQKITEDDQNSESIHRDDNSDQDEG